MDFSIFTEAVATIRQTYDLISILSKDPIWSKKERVDPNLREFHEVILAEMHGKLTESVTAYLADFGAIERAMSDPDNAITTEAVLLELGRRDDKIWNVKATVEARSRAWLKPLPEGSLERAYVWSALNVYFGDIVSVKSRDALIERADEVANQKSDEELNTPNTRIADRIRAGDLVKREEILEIIRLEKDGVLKRFKMAQRLLEDLKIPTNRAYHD